MNRRQKIFISVLISALLHFFLLGMGAYLSVVFPPSGAKAEKKPEAIEITLYPKHAYQIADIAPPEKEERPDDAKFLGMYDSKVKQETVAATSGPAAATPQPPKASHKEFTEKAEKAEREGKTTKAKPKPKEGYHLAAKPPERSSKKPPESDSEPGKKAETDGLDLFEGLSGDYFPDYRVGNQTFLNVLKYPKISYFVRMKKIFRTTFNPVPSIRQSLLQISKGQIEVVLGVTVDRSGKLSDLMVIRSSGNPAYDQEAMRTIRDSAPFASPPSEFLDQTALLRMAWTFTVYL